MTFERESAPRRRGPKRAWVGWTLAGLVAGLLGMTVWVLRTRVPEDFSRAGPAIEEHLLAPQRAAELYFGNPDLTGLQREVRFLPVGGGLEAEVRTVVEALVDGSLRGGVSPWPANAAVRDIFVGGDGVLFIDFDPALRTGAAPGDAIEWLLAASLTRTLCANFPALHGVRILVGGESSGPLIRQIPLAGTFVPAMFEEPR